MFTSDNVDPSNVNAVVVDLGFSMMKLTNDDETLR